MYPLTPFPPTPICDLGNVQQNRLFVKRDDLLPYSFGGNKARKAQLFFQEITRGGDYDHVVTYGSGHSNHCRIVANLCYAQHLGCTIIAPLEQSAPTFNRKMVEFFDAHVRMVPVDLVHQTIEDQLAELKRQGHRPYFIPGGGHGDLGTEAYVRCFQEITDFEEKQKLSFDVIAFASGTGTTQAGLICGKIIHHAPCEIVGISIARNKLRGTSVIHDSVVSYLDKLHVPYTREDVADSLHFLDDYTGGGYGIVTPSVLNTIREVMGQFGIPLDTTYTGKAFAGMLAFLREQHLENKNILFIHTGGTPLFFDDLPQICAPTQLNRLA